jgi:hypothetical protein
MEDSLLRIAENMARWVTGPMKFLLAIVPYLILRGLVTGVMSRDKSRTPTCDYSTPAKVVKLR